MCKGNMGTNFFSQMFLEFNKNKGLPNLSISSDKTDPKGQDHNPKKTFRTDPVNPIPNGDICRTLPFPNDIGNDTDVFAQILMHD